PRPQQRSEPGGGEPAARRAGPDRGRLVELGGVDLWVRQAGTGGRTLPTRRMTTFRASRAAWRLPATPRTSRRHPARHFPRTPAPATPTRRPPTTHRPSTHPARTARGSTPPAGR